MENNKNLAFIPGAYGLGMAPHVYYLLRMFPASRWQWTNVALVIVSRMYDTL